MTTSGIRCCIRATALSCILLLAGCKDTPTEESALNGAWVDGVQAGVIKVYISELRFDDGKFEWAWDDDLQQRGEYDVEDGILTVTIESSHASPQRLLGDLSRPYTLVGDTLTWGGPTFWRK